MSLPPILTTTEEVVELVAMLQAETVIAVDLEADSMHNYQERSACCNFQPALQLFCLTRWTALICRLLNRSWQIRTCVRFFTLPIMISAAWLVILILRSTVYSIP